LNKAYEGNSENGEATPPYDQEAEVERESDWGHLEQEDYEAAAKKQTGGNQQMPPARSAIKVDGERAYKKARKNKEMKLEPRAVNIKRFEINTENTPEIQFTVDCTKGTDIRSLAHDFGRNLGVGAYSKKLVRTKVGEYQLSDAMELDEFIKQHNEGN